MTFLWLHICWLRTCKNALHLCKKQNKSEKNIWLGEKYDNFRLCRKEQNNLYEDIWCKAFNGHIIALFNNSLFNISLFHISLLLNNYYFTIVKFYMVLVSMKTIFVFYNEIIAKISQREINLSPIKVDPLYSIVSLVSFEGSSSSKCFSW